VGTGSKPSSSSNGNNFDWRRDEGSRANRHKGYDFRSGGGSLGGALLKREDKGVQQKTRTKLPRRRKTYDNERHIWAAKRGEKGAKYFHYRTGTD